jgi:phosphoglycerate dehydrogenase-like enzyme
VHIIVADPAVRLALADGAPQIPTKEWTRSTELHSDSIVLLPHPSEQWQIEAIGTGNSPRLVQLLSAGVDHLHGRVPDTVTLARAPFLRARATAEVALALALSVLLRADSWAEMRRNGQWEWLQPLPRIHDQKVVVLGRGAVGSACADLFAALGARVRTFGRTTPSIDDARGELAACGVLVVALPLVPETNRIVDAAMLARLPDGAVVINVGRGALIETPALLAETASGRLRAGLDVFDEEPLPSTHPLWRAEGILISPHIGGSVVISPDDIAAILERQFTSLTAGGQGYDIVDPMFYRW